MYSQDFTGEFPQKANVADPANAPDRFGHGQHVAGIIAFNAHSSYCSTCYRKIEGIAPDVRLVNLRALDENGVGAGYLDLAAALASTV